VSRRRRVGIAAALAAGLVVGVAGARRVLPAIRRWGATDEEVRLTLPGDELVADPASTTTRAVTVTAPADAVWPWLRQLGVGRGGWYSYDWLERAVGVPVHNTDELREEWQDLREGDRVVLAPEGWLGSPGYAMDVARLDDGASLVLRQQPPEHPWDGVWSFHVRPVDDTSCRLLARSRTATPSGAGRVIASVGTLLADPITFVMERRMLLGIKDRAEQRATGVRPLG
jgi:hypothetical protein